MIDQAIHAVLLTVIIGEALKIGISYFGRKQGELFQLGGMPSLHSAVTMSLMLAVFFETGFSLLLLITMAFGIMVIRDAFGLRWEISKHSAALNKLLKNKKHLVVGHTGYEVLAGILVGTLVTLVVYHNLTLSLVQSLLP